VVFGEAASAAPVPLRLHQNGGCRRVLKTAVIRYRCSALSPMA